MRISQLIDLRPEWVEPNLIPPDSSWRGLDADPLVAAILYRRGLRTVEEARAFMDPGRQPPPDPGCVPNMERAVARVERAIERRETVGIFGDYDVDGVTSTAILTQALRVSLGEARVIPRLPERDEGYGLNRKAIAGFRDAGVSLVIAVDCGSTEHAHAAQIAESGMDLVIVDHHQMRDTGPPQAITVSPQLNGDGLYHDLTAAGVAYLLVSALAERGMPVIDGSSSDAAAYLDLVALGTVADVAPLVGVNRSLVARGVESIREKPRAGVAALIQAAQLDRAAVTASDISFSLAPRLNAAGRIGSPRLAFELVMTNDPTEARRLAAELEQLNFRRKTRSSQVLAEAYEAIMRQHDWRSRPVFAVHHPQWEAGLVGAVASRIAEEVRRPVFLFREENGMLFGSARSVDGINLVETLHEIGPKLKRYGGHSLAAGLTLRSDLLGDLEAHMAETLRLQGTTIPVPRRLQLDATLPPGHLRIQTVRELGRMEPFGRGNEQPVLLIPDAELLRYSAMGQDRSHLKIIAKSGGRQVEAVFWGAAWRSQELVGRRTIDLAGKLEINSWNGQDRLQMVLEDFRAG